MREALTKARNDLTLKANRIPERIDYPWPSPLKPKTEITVPKEHPPEGGIKAGDQFEFCVSGRVIILSRRYRRKSCKTSAKSRTRKMQRHIRKSNNDYWLAESPGFQISRRASSRGATEETSSLRMTAPFLVRTTTHYERFAPAAS